MPNQNERTRCRYGTHFKAMVMAQCDELGLRSYLRELFSVRLEPVET